MELKLITEFTESLQYRTKHAFKQVTARQVCDHVFMDMIAVWILYNEFETAPLACKYAEKTVAYNGFKTFRQSSTDLYLGLHVVTEKRTDLLSSEADLTLLDRVNLDELNIIRYLRQTAQNNVTPSITRQTLQRLEKSLHIENSNYRSVRRLAQSWPTLSTSQKRLVLTRMIFYYKTHARRSEMFQQIQKLAVGKGLLDTTASNPENKVLKTMAAGAAGGVLGYAAGYRLGKSLTA